MSRVSQTLELERLHKLKENGVISEKEFEEMKHKLLYGKEKCSIIRWLCNCIKSTIVGTGKLVLYIVLAFLLFIGIVSFVASDNNTPKARKNNLNLEKECSQASKDGYYAGALYRECFLNLGLSEFEKGLGIIGNYAGTYKQSINCPLGEIEEEKRYRLGVEQAVNKGIQSSESVEKFCQNEKAYFDKIYIKYSSAN